MGYSKVNSQAGSRAGSRPQSRGPTDNEDELLSGFNFGNLDELISIRLANFMKNMEDTKKTVHKYPMNSLSGLVQTITNQRNPIPPADREMLLNQLYSLNVKTNEGNFQEMVDVFKSCKGYEQLVAIRNVAATGVAHCDEVADEMLEFLESLEEKIASPDLENSIKQQYIYAYSSMNLAIYEGSGAYSVDKKINFLFEILLGLTSDLENNAPVISSLIYGIGALVTILENSASLNGLLENLLESTVDLLLDCDIPEITKPMAMLFALSYEMYHYDNTETYEDDEEPQPYIYTYEIEQRIQELVSSNLKQSKKQQTAGRSVFREAVNTVKTYSDRIQRIQLEEEMRARAKSKSQAETKDNTLTHIRLSKSRSIAIKSWLSFFRIIELKWVFGNSLYNQLAHNSSLVSMIEHKKVFRDLSPSYGEDVDTSDPAFTETARMSHMRKQKIIANGRMEKLTNQLEQTGLTDNS